MKTYYYSLTLAFLMLIPFIFTAQSAFQWDKTFVGSWDDVNPKIIQTNDGNFVFTGVIQSGDGDFSATNDTPDLWVIKMDESGEVIWKKNHSVDRHIKGFDIKVTSGGGYIVTATKTQLFTDDEIWIVKLDEFGNLEWEYTKEGKYYSMPMSIVYAADGNFVIAGYSFQQMLGFYEYWSFKLDNSGQLIWENSQEASERLSIVKILETDGQDLLIIGNTTTDDLIWLQKLNKEGNILWEKTYDSQFAQAAEDGIIASDGSVLIGGYRYIAGSKFEFLIMKTDENGSIEWERTFGGSEDEFASAVIETSNAGFLIAGRAKSTDGDVGENNGGPDIWIVKLDMHGQLLWSVNHGSDQPESCNSICLTEDGFMAAGSVRNPATARLNIHIVKYSTDPTNISTNPDSDLSIELFPNPTYGTINISSNYDGIHHLEIFNLNGQKVFSKNVMPGNSITLENFESGIYEAKIQREEVTSIQKLIITN